MEMWFSENHSPHVRFDIRVEKQLFSVKSEYQRIDVFDSPEFGKFLTLDGSVIFSEQDCFIYNEMVVHVPMSVHPNVKKVLIIGGGDGGVAKELLHYDSIEHIDLVEQDSTFVEVCKEYFPTTAEGLYDERVHMYNTDALRFLRSQKAEYDLIINDATDPFGASEGFFTREFYGNCYKALKEDGILVYQHGSPFYDEDEDACRSMHRKVYHTFPISRVYQAHIPTSPSGYWLFGFASKKFDPIKDQNKELWKSLNLKTKYYNSDIHTASFMLPQYVKDMLNEK